jgi:transposase
VEGRKLFYLPPYSLNLSPIEEEFSKIERFLRQIGTRTREVLVETVGKALDEVSGNDARDFLAHCGQRTLAQHL